MGVPIVWLEYHRTKFPKYRDPQNEHRQRLICELAGRTYDPPGEEPGFREVTFATASRAGEPFENLIDLSGLPNVLFHDARLQLGRAKWRRDMQAQGYEHWDNLVGIRADGIACGCTD